MGNAIQLKNVTKIVQKKRLIDSLSLDIKHGEVFGLLGPNGAGKTTTIRMIVGLISMSSGEIIIQGTSITKDFQAAIRNVGAIVENPELYGFLSGYENLVHFARMSSGVSKQRINEVVELVGLDKRINEKVKNYSLGMRQRLGIAQALLHRPTVLILDEPTNGLDPAGIRELREYLRRLARQEGVAVIVSSHLLSEMELMCDRIAIIQKGKLMGVRELNEFVQGDVTIIFEVDLPSRATEELEQDFPGVTSGKGSIQMAIDRNQIPMVTAKLVKAGVKIYGIKPEHKSLEEKFLEITGGVGIV